MPDRMPLHTFSVSFELKVLIIGTIRDTNGKDKYFIVKSQVLSWIFSGADYDKSGYEAMLSYYEKIATSRNYTATNSVTIFAKLFSIGIVAGRFQYLISIRTILLV